MYVKKKISISKLKRYFSDLPDWSSKLQTFTVKRFIIFFTFYLFISRSEDVRRTDSFPWNTTSRTKKIRSSVFIYLIERRRGSKRLNYYHKFTRIVWNFEIHINYFTSYTRKSVYANFHCVNIVKCKKTTENNDVTIWSKI